jgi:Tfp pilus assembly protein PilF
MQPAAPKESHPTAVAGPGRPHDKDLPPSEAAKVCMRTAQDLEKAGALGQAVFLYEKARADNPRMREATWRLAVLYDRLGETARAQAEFQKLLASNPRDAEVLNDLGYSCYNHGQFDHAETYLRQAVAVDAHHARAWINLGMVLGAQGRYPESLEAFSHAVPPAQAQCNLAFLLTAKGKREEAKEAYRRALSMDPNLVVARGALEKLEHAKTTASMGSGPGQAPEPQAMGAAIGVAFHPEVGSPQECSEQVGWSSDSGPQSY